MRDSVEEPDLSAATSAGMGTVALRWLALLAAASWLGYLICSGVPQVQPEVFRATIAFQVVALAPAVLYAAYLLVRRRLPGGSLLDWPLLLLLGAYGVATVASVAWRVSLESTLILLLALLVFYALSDVHLLDATGLQRAFMLAAAAASVWALWIVAGDYGDWLRFARSTTGGFQLGDLIPPTVPKVHDVSDHPNILGMVLVLAMPFYVLAVYRAGSAWLRFFWGLLLFAALWAVFLTLSRGAWIGAAVGVGLTVGGMGVARRPWSLKEMRAGVSGRLRGRPSLVAAAGVLALFALVVAVALVAVRWNVRPQWLFRESLSPRRDVFDAGVSMFRDHLLSGGGPGSFALLYPQYSGEFPIHAIHAHNGFLQVAVDTGLIGLAALAVLLLALAWMLWQSFRRGNVEQRLLAVTCAAALAGFAVHNLADAANIWKATLVAVAAVTAIVVKNYRSLEATGEAEAKDASSSRDVARRAVRLLPRGLLAVAFVALPLVWLRIDVAHRHYSHSISQLGLGHITQAISEGKQAVDEDPDFAVYQLQLGVTEGMAVIKGDLTSPEPAIASLQRGLKLEPRSAIGYANLARMLVIAGRKAEARDAALQARRFAGADSTMLLAAAGVLEDVGAPEAIPTYGMALSRMPSLADSPFWQGSEFRRQHYAEIVGNSLISLSPCATGELVARAGDNGSQATTLSLTELRDACSAIVFADPSSLGARIDLAEVSMALKDYQTAYDLLSYTVSRQPDLGRARTVMGEWYAAEGEIGRAREEWLTGGQLGEAESLLLLGDTYPPGQVPAEVARRLSELAPAVAEGPRDYLIGYLYYRMRFARESSPVILLPGEWQDAIPGLYDRIQQALKQWESAG